jgi:hypothetical protein
MPNPPGPSRVLAIHTQASRRLGRADSERRKGLFPPLAGENFFPPFRVHPRHRGTAQAQPAGRTTAACREPEKAEWRGQRRRGPQLGPEHLTRCSGFGLDSAWSPARPVRIRFCLRPGPIWPGRTPRRIQNHHLAMGTTRWDRPGPGPGCGNRTAAGRAPPVIGRARPGTGLRSAPAMDRPGTPARTRRASPAVHGRARLRARGCAHRPLAASRARARGRAWGRAGRRAAHSRALIKPYGAT